MSLFTICSVTSAQTDTCRYSYSCQVCDKNTGEPLSYASVYVRELERGEIADENGVFAIEELCAGSYTLVLRHVGCREKQVRVELESSMSDRLYLNHRERRLDEVAVEAEADAESAATVYAALGRDELHHSQGKSLAESLRLLSGVNALQSGPTISKPLIHGLHSQRILILNNGIRQEGQQWGQDHAPEIDPSSAQDFKVVKGAGAVRYGADAIGGVILLAPAKLPDTQTIQGSIGVVGQSNNRQGRVSVSLEGGFANGVGWRVQASGKKGGDAKAPDYRLSNTGVEERNFSTTLGISKKRYGAAVYYSYFDSDIAVLRSAHTGNLSDLIDAINGKRPLFVEDFTYKIDNPKQEVQHHLLKLNANYALGDIGELKFQYGFQSNDRYEYDRRRGDNFYRPSISLTIQTYTLDMSFEQKSRGLWKAEFGLSGIYQRNSNGEGTNARFLIPDYRQYGLGVFAIEKYARKRWEIEAGIRYDIKKLHPFVFNFSRQLLTPKYSFNNITSSIGGLLELSKRLTLRANLSTAWRPPHVSELFSHGLHHGAASFEQGLFYPDGVLATDLNDRKPNGEHAIKAILSAEYKHEKLAIEGSAYHNTIHSYLYLLPVDIRLTIRGAFPVWQYSQTDARFVGVDAAVNFQPNTHWSYRGKMSLIRAADLKTGGVLINIPANSLRNTIKYSQSWLGMKEIYVSLEALTVGRQNRAPVVFTDFRNREVPAEPFDYKGAPDAYTVFNFHSGVETDKLRLGFSVENLFNTSYRDYMNRFRYYVDEVGINYSIRLFYNF